MTTVSLSPKYQVVIPKEVREKMRLNSGIKLEVIAHADRIELIPVKPIQELRGVLKGMNTIIKRAKDRI